MHIYLCPSPELYPCYHRPQATVIIVDIFRASTTMVTAFAHGARHIYPVATTEEAQEEGRQRQALIAAERNIMRCPFAQLGNDPLEYTPEVVQGKDIVFTTTNGTRALRIAQAHGAETILIGSLLNLQATLRYCASLKQDILVLAAGWKGQVALEDILYAGALAHRAQAGNLGSAHDDTTRLAQSVWEMHCQSSAGRLAYLQQSEHYQRLEQAGYASTVPYCLELDRFDLVLRLEGDHLRRVPQTIATR